MKHYDEDLFNKKVCDLEKTLFTNFKGSFGLSGDLGDEKSDTFLKTMSNAGEDDASMADVFENWLKDNKIKYKRFKERKFIINTNQFYNILLNESF